MSRRSPLTSEQQAEVDFAVNDLVLSNLIVTRDLGESIVVSDSNLNLLAVVTFVESRSGHKIRLSCRSPTEINLDRIEVYNAKLRDIEAEHQGK